MSSFGTYIIVTLFSILPHSLEPRFDATKFVYPYILEVLIRPDETLDVSIKSLILAQAKQYLDNESNLLFTKLSMKLDSDYVVMRYEGIKIWEGVTYRCGVYVNRSVFFNGDFRQLADQIDYLLP